MIAYYPEDGAHDAIAVVEAELRGDRRGTSVLLKSCDLLAVAEILASYVAGALVENSDRLAPDVYLAHLRTAFDQAWRDETA